LKGDVEGYITDDVPGVEVEVVGVVVFDCGEDCSS
jgi:hypothetical protein